MPGETEKKPKRSSGVTHDGDDHPLVCTLKVMKITPRPNITGINMRLGGLVKKPVAEEICARLLYAGQHSDSFPFAFVMLFAVYLPPHRIYAHSMTSHITLYL